MHILYMSLCISDSSLRQCIYYICHYAFLPVSSSPSVRFNPRRLMGPIIQSLSLLRPFQDVFRSHGQPAAGNDQTHWLVHQKASLDGQASDLEYDAQTARICFAHLPLGIFRGTGEFISTILYLLCSLHPR